MFMSEQQENKKIPDLKTLNSKENSDLESSGENGENEKTNETIEKEIDNTGEKEKNKRKIEKKQ